MHGRGARQRRQRCQAREQSVFIQSSTLQLSGHGTRSHAISTPNDLFRPFDVAPDLLILKDIPAFDVAPFLAYVIDSM